jgi:hypothetical protein
MDFTTSHNPMLSPTLRQIEFVRAIARTGAVTRAAAVHMSQPTLARRSRGQLKVNALRLAMLEDLAPVHLAALLAAFAKGPRHGSAPDPSGVRGAVTAIWP